MNGKSQPFDVISEGWLFIASTMLDVVLHDIQVFLGFFQQKRHYPVNLIKLSVK
ncbi:hypothetical protein ACUL41_02970 [Virgibacillus natechei]